MIPVCDGHLRPGGFAMATGCRLLTSSPHSVTVTTFPDMSMRWTVLLDTSLLALVVRRVTSSTVLHTPITSVERDGNEKEGGGGVTNSVVTKGGFSLCINFVDTRSNVEMREKPKVVCCAAGSSLRRKRNRRQRQGHD